MRRVHLINPLLVLGLVKSVPNDIVARLETEGVLHLSPLPLAEEGMTGVQSRHPSLVGLFKLVATVGVREEISEIRKQVVEENDNKP